MKSSMMHNQGGYVQGSAGQVARPQQQQQQQGQVQVQQQQVQQVQPAPPQQHHVLPSPSQFSPFMVHNPQAQFVPGGHFIMPQHIPAAQLPQLPAQFISPQQDQACLLVIPMHFNGRDLSYTMQTGILVPAHTSTFHGGFHIIHQSHFPLPHQMQQQQQQQPHAQQMSNGFGQGQQQGTGGSPGGSSGFGDAVSTSSSRENATHTSPVNAGSNNVANHAVNMDPRSVMYPYPNQSLSYTVGPGMPMHPGFVPQMQMHPQMMNAYGGQQQLAVHAGSQSDENVQGVGHTADERGERQQSVQEMANGVQEPEHRSGSSAQSRSTSYSSNMDIENNVGHSNTDNASAAEPDAQDDHVHRSRTPSPEDVTLRGSVDGTKEGMSNGDINHQRDAFPYQDGLENNAYDETADHPGQASAEFRADALSPSKIRSNSRGISSPLLQMNPTSGSALGGNIRSNTDSPLSTRSTNSPHILAASHNQNEQPSSTTETPRAESPVTPTVVDSAPKSWAAITQAGPKAVAAATAPTNQKLNPRPPMAPRTEAPRPPGSGGAKSGGGNYQEDGYGPGYRNGGQRSSAGAAGSGSGGQDRRFEFPRLQTDEADAFPDAQQVYIRDIPTSVSSTSMHKAMQAFGNVVDVRLRYHQDHSTRFCFILFDNRSAVDRLLEKGTITVDGKTLNVQKKAKTPLHTASYTYRNSRNNYR